MASSFSHTPTTTNDATKFAGQPLIFTCDDTSTPDRFVVQVYERDAPGSSSGQVDLGEFYLTPNAGGVAHFDLSNVIDGRLNAPNTTIVGDQVHETDYSSGFALGSSDRVMREYYVELYRYDSSGKSSLQDSSTVAVWAGAVQISQGYEPDAEAPYHFTASTSKGFLTDRYWDSSTDIEATMADEDQGVWSIAVPDQWQTSPSNIQDARYTLYHSGGSTSKTLSQVVDSATVVNYNYLTGPLAPLNVSIFFAASWVPTWTRYEIVFRNNLTSNISNKYIVHKDCRPYKHDPVQLAWANTVGGWDYLRFDGRNIKTVNSETKMYRKTIGSYGDSVFGFNAWDRQDTPYHVTAREQYALRNQFFTASERDLLQYAFRSKNVMFRVGTGSWLPCNIQTNSYTVQPAASRLFEVSFNIELAQEIRC